MQKEEREGAKAKDQRFEAFTLTLMRPHIDAPELDLVWRSG
jgi:hypothetical protein